MFRTSEGTPNGTQSRVTTITYEKRMIQMAKATGKKKATKSKSQTFGIDAMVDAVYNDLQGNKDDIPASARELTKKAIKVVLQTEHALIQGAVANNDEVSYIGFGTFKQVTRSERKGRNPQTGAELLIPATSVPSFKPGKGFKDAVKA